MCQNLLQVYKPGLFINGNTVVSISNVRRRLWQVFFVAIQRSDCVRQLGHIGATCIRHLVHTFMMACDWTLKAFDALFNKAKDELTAV